MWVEFLKPETRESGGAGEEIKISEIIIGKWKCLEF
jgi:hypothetical protein